MNASLRSSLPRSTRSSASRCSAFCKTPSSTQVLNRRKHVAYGGYRSGMSAQGAPVRRIQRMPLSTSRGSRHGRPRPSSRTTGFGNNGSTAAHCSSVRSISTLDHERDPQSIEDRFPLTHARLRKRVYEMRSRPAGDASRLLDSWRRAASATKYLNASHPSGRMCGKSHRSSN